MESYLNFSSVYKFLIKKNLRRSYFFKKVISKVQPQRFGFLTNQGFGGTKLTTYFNIKTKKIY